MLKLCRCASVIKAPYLFEDGLEGINVSVVIVIPFFAVRAQVGRNRAQNIVRLKIHQNPISDFSNVALMEFKPASIFAVFTDKRQKMTLRPTGKSSANILNDSQERNTYTRISKYLTSLTELARSSSRMPQYRILFPLHELC